MKKKPAMHAETKFETHLTSDTPALHSLESGSGPSLLLLHGLFDSLETWTSLLPCLSDRFKLYALDLPGFGKSPLPEIWPSSISGMVDAVIHFLDTKALERVTLVGNSMGGGLSLAIAQKHPDRIEKIALLNPYGLPAVPMAAAGARRPVMGFILPYLLRKSAIRKCAKGIFSRAFYDKTFMSDSLLERVVAPFSSLGKRKDLFRFLRSILTEEIREIDRKLPGVKQGVLILWGEADAWLSNEHRRRLEVRLPQVKLVTLAECGHLPQIEKPKEVAAALIPFLLDDNT